MTAGRRPARNSAWSSPPFDPSLEPYAGLAVSTAGELFIADLWNNRIRKVDTAGTITTVAGGGTHGLGDGGPATGAQLNHPSGLALDPAGNLLIADSGTHRIRKVDTAGMITTVAGGVGQGPPLSIVQSPAGVAVSGPFVYLADSFDNVVRRLDTRTGSEIVVAGSGSKGFGGDGGPATSAQLNFISSAEQPFQAGLAVDPAGDLYIADAGNSRVRKVDATGTITTVAGNGSRASAATAGRPPARDSPLRPAWRWTRPATCTSPTLEQSHPQG